MITFHLEVLNNNKKNSTKKEHLRECQLDTKHKYGSFELYWKHKDLPASLL